MPIAECNGLRIAYEEQGSGDPPLLFVHGGACDRSFFAPQAEYFSRNHRVVSLDLRGHGESDQPEGDYPIAAYSSDIGELIQQLDLQKPIVVGHSLGGSIALQVAADFPDRVGAIVMVEATPIAPPPEVQQAFEGVLAAIKAGQRGPWEDLISGAFLPTSDPKVVEHVKRVMMSAPDHLVAVVMRGVLDFDGAAAAAKCAVPALDVGGAEPANPPHVIGELVRDVVTCQAVGAGHFPQLEVPDQVNLMIEAFLEHYVNQASATSATSEGMRGTTPVSWR